MSTDSSPSGIHATEHGQVPYVAAKRILRDIDDMTVAVRTLGREPAGSVHFGCIESVSMMVAYPLVVEVIKRLPRVRLVLMSGQGRDLYRRLGSGDLDFALMASDEEATTLTRRALIREELFVAGSASASEYTLPDELSMKELSDLPFILPSATSFSVRTLLKNSFGGATFDPRIAAEVDFLALTKRLVLEGYGHALFPWTVVRDEVAASKIKLRRIAGQKLERELALYSAQQRLSSIATAAVLKVLAEVISELIATNQWRHVSLIATDTD